MNKVSVKLSNWWDSLATSLLSGADGLGVYVDRQGLTLAHVRKTLSGFQVENFLLLPGEFDKMAGLAPTLQETIGAWNLGGSLVSLAVSPELGFFQHGTLPVAAAENLDQVIAYEMDRFLPLPAPQLYYRFHILKETDREIHFMLLAVPRQGLEGVLTLMKEADLRLTGIELAPLAAAAVFAELAGKKIPASWLLLHLGDDSFNLTHFHDQTVRKFIQKRGVRKKDFSREILAQIERVVEEGQKPSLLCAYGEHRPELGSRLQEKFALEVVYPGHFVRPGGLPETAEGTSFPALGAALSCLGKTARAANLLPLTEREPVKFQRFSLTTSLLLALVTLCLIWAGSALLHTRYLLFQVNRQIARLAPEAKEVESLLTEGRGLAQQMESLRKLGTTPDKLEILKNLTQVIPQNTWLHSVRLGKQNVEVSGSSQSAAELIPLLEKSSWLKKTEFASPVVTDANRLEHFKIKAEIKGREAGS